MRAMQYAAAKRDLEQFQSCYAWSSVLHAECDGKLRICMTGKIWSLLRAYVSQSSEGAMSDKSDKSCNLPGPDEMNPCNAYSADFARSRLVLPAHNCYRHGIFRHRGGADLSTLLSAFRNRQCTGVFRWHQPSQAQMALRACSGDILIDFLNQSILGMIRAWWWATTSTESRNWNRGAVNLPVIGELPRAAWYTIMQAKMLIMVIDT